MSDLRIPPPGSYNERLFGKNKLRAFFHMARYRWLHQKVSAYYANNAPRRMLELGCFDGKAIAMLSDLAPHAYVGFDANWEGGLSEARGTWSEFQGYEFIESHSLKEFRSNLTGKFDAAISMETLEHLPPAELPEYLEEVSRVVDGYFFVTVPNEKGPFLLLKQVVKSLFAKGGEKYSLKELMFATLGRLDKVERDEHKGFDWSVLIHQMERWFEIVEVGGRPFRFLPKFSCFSICIVARTRASDRAVKPGPAG